MTNQGIETENKEANKLTKNQTTKSCICQCILWNLLLQKKSERTSNPIEKSIEPA